MQATSTWWRDMQRAITGVPRREPTSAQLDQAHRRLNDSCVTRVAGTSLTLLAGIARGEGRSDTEVRLARIALVLAGELAARVDEIHREPAAEEPGGSPPRALAAQTSVAPAATHSNDTQARVGRDPDVVAAEEAVTQSHHDLRNAEDDYHQGRGSLTAVGAARDRREHAARALKSLKVERAIDSRPVGQTTPTAARKTVSPRRAGNLKGTTE